MQTGSDVDVNLVIYFTITLAVMSLLIFVLFYLFHKKLTQQKKVSITNLIKEQDLDRERLARDLHDEMGSELSAIIFKLDEIKNTNKETLELRDEAIQQLNEAINKIRQVSYDIFPPTLMRFNLAGVLTELADKYKTKGIALAFNTNCHHLKFDKSSELHLYRIVKELLNNSEKHSNANKIEILMMYDKPYLTLTYTDNGKGIIPTLEAKGTGLKNIKLRARMLDAELLISGETGFNLKLKLKIDEIHMSENYNTIRE